MSLYAAAPAWRGAALRCCGSASRGRGAGPREPALAAGPE
ncbi:hypothetical protein MYA_5945 [Burkholderia sp. KJ006]|nr:hypothetical protein MYA_5945 [Burkholderia sp. KJ006]